MRSWCSRLAAKSSAGLSVLVPRAGVAARAALVACAAALVLVTLTAPSAHAQNLPDPEDTAPQVVLNTNGIVVPPAARPPEDYASGTGPSAGSVADSSAQSIVQEDPPTFPLAPIVRPLVGPPIKHVYADEVDRRTTAFIPTSIEALDLTPIEMPDTDENWARVDLSEQLLVAYSGNRVVRAFVIASGLPGTPTVTGEFRIRMKVRSQTMSGGIPGTGNYYNLPNVEWVQYFYADYGLHGTYWHNSFGTPRSHGCVNMTNADAKWMWDFLGPVWDGTTVWQRTSAEELGSLVIVHD